MILLAVFLILTYVPPKEQSLDLVSVFIAALLELMFEAACLICYMSYIN